LTEVPTAGVDARQTNDAPGAVDHTIDPDPVFSAMMLLWHDSTINQSITGLTRADGYRDNRQSISSGILHCDNKNVRCVHEADTGTMTEVRENQASSILLLWGLIHIKSVSYIYILDFL
jgi:hypothetical protein